MFIYIYETDNKDKKNMIINIIDSELEDLKKEIKKKPEEEWKIEKIDEILEIGIHYKKRRQFLWIQRIVRPMNHRDLN